MSTFVLLTHRHFDYLLEGLLEGMRGGVFEAGMGSVVDHEGEDSGGVEGDGLEDGVGDIDTVA